MTSVEVLQKLTCITWREKHHLKKSRLNARLQFGWRCEKGAQKDRGKELWAEFEACVVQKLALTMPQGTITTSQA